MFSFGNKLTPEQQAAMLWDLPEGRTAMKKLLASERKPLTHASLDYKFLIPNGKKIYQFPKGVNLPGERFAAQQRFMSYLLKGLSMDEDIKLDGAIEKLLEDGIGKSSKNVAGIGAILQERKKRRSLSVHHELFYNLIAVELIHEDENPEVYDNDMQMEKVKAFKDMTKEGSTYFFFQSHGLTRYSNLLSMSQTEWDQYWAESKLQEKVVTEALKLILSQITSIN